MTDRARNLSTVWLITYDEDGFLQYDVATNTPGILLSKKFEFTPSEPIIGKRCRMKASVCQFYTINPNVGADIPEVIFSLDGLSVPYSYCYSSSIYKKNVAIGQYQKREDIKEIGRKCIIGTAKLGNPDSFQSCTNLVYVPETPFELTLRMERAIDGSPSDPGIYCNICLEFEPIE